MQINNDRELEVKLFLLHPQKLHGVLERLGAELIHPRVNEWNLRFDTANKDLSSTGQVLRLRKDTHTRLTYKSEAAMNSEVADRQELEVDVSDFDAARKILEKLGFSVFVMYEKFRTTWKWMDCEITLDEMPYGCFCEVEGSNPAAIQKTVEVLGLNWERRILTSYLGIFSLLKDAGKIKAGNLIFSEFVQEKIDPSTLSRLNILPADDQ